MTRTAENNDRRPEIAEEEEEYERERETSRHDFRVYRAATESRHMRYSDTLETSTYRRYSDRSDTEIQGGIPREKRFGFGKRKSTCSNNDLLVGAQMG